MIDREPVDIMGVTAFPNPNKDERVIRFIDSEYHTLFTIKDGESIVITRFDGEKMVFPCKYIDDCQPNFSLSQSYMTRPCRASPAAIKAGRAFSAPPAITTNAPLMIKF